MIGRRLMIRGWLPLLALLSIAPPAPSLAQAVPGDCCLLLLVPVGARSSALGGAITARTGVDAVFRNPAGLAGVDGAAFVVHHSDRNVVAVDAFSLLLTPSPGKLALSYQLFDSGTIVTTDEFGQRTGELSYRDHLVVTSFATGLGAGVAAGVNYKLFQERVDCRGICGGQERVGTTHATDIGVRYHPRWNPALELGAAAVNVPLSARAEDEPGRFPSRIHVGASYDLLRAFVEDDAVALRLAVDVQDRLRQPGGLVPSAGIELDVQRAVFLRAGYTLGEGLASGAAVGVELRYDRFDIGVSRSFVNSSLEEEEPFQVSFAINF